MPRVDKWEFVDEEPPSYRLIEEYSYPGAQVELIPAGPARRSKRFDWTIRMTNIATGARTFVFDMRFQSHPPEVYDLGEAKRAGARYADNDALLYQIGFNNPVKHGYCEHCQEMTDIALWHGEVALYGYCTVCQSFVYPITKTLPK